MIRFLGAKTAVHILFMEQSEVIRPSASWLPEVDFFLHYDVSSNY